MQGGHHSSTTGPAGGHTLDKIVQVAGPSHLQVLPLPHIPCDPADLSQAYKQLIATSPTSPDQPLRTIMRGTKLICVMIGMLCEALRVMLTTMKILYSLYSLHSLRRGVPWLPIIQGLTNSILRGMVFGKVMVSGSTSQHLM